MSLMYPFILFMLIPLWFIYKRDKKEAGKHSKREKTLLYFSIVFSIIALSRPVIPNSLNKQNFDAKDFIIAIDASFSMQADDLEPSRYELAKQNLKQIIEKLPKNRFSIFAFTSNAILISPPTTDTAISLMALDSIEPSYILTKGTSIQKLLETISKISYDEKNLIIFTDGGEEYTLNSLVNLSKKNHIIPYVVATGSSRGTALTHNNKNLKDEQNNIVISMINPILEDFAKMSGGEYYSLDSSSKDISNKIVSDINAKKDKTKKVQIDVLTYTELFYFPLILSILAFIASVTKIHQLYIFIPLLLLPNQAKSSLIDFYHLKNANQSFKNKTYMKSAKEFQKLNPSVESFYNRAVAYYKAENYKMAIKIFTSIKSTNPIIKQTLFYSMGNCAIKMQKYKRAKIYYEKALNLGFDDDSYNNLSYILSHKLKEKKDVSNSLPKKHSNKKTSANKKKDTKKDSSKKSKEKSGNSNQKSSQSSNGSSNSKNKKKNSIKKKTDKTINSKYKIGYKAYELINKGYTNETKPW